MSIFNTISENIANSANSLSVISSFLQLLQKSDERTIKRRESLEEKALLDNDNIYPYRDCNGRLHAPVDGYKWDDRIYGKGAYLSEEYCTKAVKLETARFRATYAFAKQFINAHKDTCNVKVKHGQVWKNQGLEMCNIFVDDLTTRQKSWVEGDFLERVWGIICDTEDELKKARLEIKEGKTPLNIKVVGIDTKQDPYSGEEKLILRATDLATETAVLSINLTKKSKFLTAIKDNGNIDSLVGLAFSLAGDVQEEKYSVHGLRTNVPTKAYKVLRPTKIVQITQ